MRFLFAAALLATVCLAEQPQDILARKNPARPEQLAEPFFPKPGYFRQHFYTPASHVELRPPARLADFIVEHRLELSIKSYLDLVMANNTDIAIQKVVVDINRNAITRAFSVFDPFAVARFNSTRTQTPSSNLLVGAQTLNQLNQPLSLTYQQILPTGAQYFVNFGSNKISSNSAFSTYNPQLNASLNFSASQPLLRGRGGYITRMPISIARSRLRASEYNLEDQVIQLVSAAENVYWDAVGARENLRVQEESLKLADTALQRAKKELELGAISPLEIYQPEANYANAEIFVTQARYRLQQAEDALRKQIGADLDPKIRDYPLVLTEPVNPPPENLALDKEATVQRALAMRPDLKNARQNLDVDELNLRAANNALLPDLSLTAQYGSSGLGGVFYPRTNLLNPGAAVLPIYGGIGDALAGVFGFGYPVYGFGLTLRLPIKDRKAVADVADAVVNRRLDALHERSVEQSIRLQVLNVISQVENSRASVQLARVARDLAQKRVEADQKRYELGTTTLFFVLASQGDYTQAENNLVTQTINYRRNLISLLQRTGQLLEERGIVLQ